MPLQQITCLTLRTFSLLPVSEIIFFAFDTLLLPAIEAYLAVFGALLRASVAINHAFVVIFLSWHFLTLETFSASQSFLAAFESTCIPFLWCAHPSLRDHPICLCGHYINLSLTPFALAWKLRSYPWENYMVIHKQNGDRLEFQDDCNINYLLKCLQICINLQCYQQNNGHFEFQDAFTPMTW